MAESQRSVAFIGLGQMGLPMARRLVAAGHSVRGFDISDAARQAFAAASGQAFASAREAATGADVAIAILPTSAIVRQALTAADGALEGLTTGALVVDMSSSVPTDTVALGADLAKLGFRLIDAPVSGGVKRAVDGTLTIMVGGDEASLAQARPLLEAMGSKIFPTGRLGSGHAMKALNNFVSAAGVVAAMEAVIAGRKFGLDPERMIDILNVSTGRNNATEVKMKPFVLSETYASGFGLGLMAKDVGIAAGLAQSLGLHLPMLHEAAQLWRDAAGTLGAASDHTEIIKHIVAAAEKGEPA